MGRLGLSPHAFWSATLGEVVLALSNNNLHHDMLQRREWERTRWLATVLMQPHLKKGHKLLPEDLAVFEWEKAPAKGTWDEERMAAHAKWLAENTYLAL